MSITDARTDLRMAAERTQEYVRILEVRNITGPRMTFVRLIAQHIALILESVDDYIERNGEL